METAEIASSEFPGPIAVDNRAIWAMNRTIRLGDASTIRTVAHSVRQFIDPPSQPRAPAPTLPMHGPAHVAPGTVGVEHVVHVVHVVQACVGLAGPGHGECRGPAGSPRH
jgi:hypothetical protein